jgi:hypothetical protein
MVHPETRIFILGNENPAVLTVTVEVPTIVEVTVAVPVPDSIPV